MNVVKILSCCQSKWAATWTPHRSLCEQQIPSAHTLTCVLLQTHRSGGSTEPCGQTSPLNTHRTMDTEKWSRNALGKHSPGGGEERAIDASKCGQGNRDGHDPGHDPQKLLSKSLGKKTRSGKKEVRSLSQLAPHFPSACLPSTLLILSESQGATSGTHAVD